MERGSHGVTCFFRGSLCIPWIQDRRCICLRQLLTICRVYLPIIARLQGSELCGKWHLQQPLPGTGKPPSLKPKELTCCSPKSFHQSEGITCLDLVA